MNALPFTARQFVRIFVCRLIEPHRLQPAVCFFESLFSGGAELATERAAGAQLTTECNILAHV